MTRLMSAREVEEWLDANPAATQDYFLRKVELDLINKWLVAHGFLSIHDYVTSRRGSYSLGTSSNTSPSSPVDKVPPENSCFGEVAPQGLGQRRCVVGAEWHPSMNTSLSPSPTSALPSPHIRTNSKKYLRQDFAKAKSRSVVVHTGEQGAASAGGNAATQSRRSSLKGLRKYASLPPSSINILSLLIESKVKLPQYACKGRESKWALRYANERDFLLDIVKDIANDLDLKSITYKIVTNLAILLDADGASLFLVDGPRGKQVLVSKIFDVHCGSNFIPTATDDNVVQVPWGKGILGYVAETGETVNLADASLDPRYNDEVDRITGYVTETLLCMPVRNAYDEIIAVAQVINKNPRHGCHPIDNAPLFTRDDEKLFETYLQFVGIAITNAQLFETSRREYDRNRSLLEIVHDLFEEQTSLEKVVLKIMQRAQRLLKCERAAVLLLQEEIDDHVKFVKIFDLSSQQAELSDSPSGKPETRMTKALLKMAEQVAASGEVMNVAETLEVEKGILGNVRSLLSMPIKDRDFRVIGVAQIVNKLNGHPFDDNDEQLFEAFTIFCGLGINNTMMYNELEKSIAKQRVAIEVLSYHATVSAKDLERFLDPSWCDVENWDLRALDFDDFLLADDEMIIAAARMFKDLGLLNRFKIHNGTLLRWLLTVRKNYRDVPYHNWRHAFNVAQVMFAILVGCEMKDFFTDLEYLGMFVGCLCHDLDHRGTNNAYQQKTGSALALLYGTKNTMEQHHFNHAVMILNSDGHNIFATLSSESYSKVMNILKHAILSTDLSVYFQVRANFFPLVEKAEWDWSRDDQREMLRSMLMTACDIAASTKPWHVQQKVAELVTSEFFNQGDKERTELNIQPQALMDREKKHELPGLQMTWISDICLPLYQVLSKLNNKLDAMVEGATANMARWAEVAASTLTPQDSPVHDDHQPELLESIV